MRKLKPFLITIFVLICFILVLSSCSTNEYKISFIVDGTVHSTITTKGSETIELPAEPQKENYVFDGWFLDEGTWKQKFDEQSLLYISISADMNVYAKFSPVVQHSHSFDSWRSDGETTHSHSCLCGQKETENHNWEVKQAALVTCISGGTETYECSDCGETKSVSIPASSVHSPSQQIVEGSVNPCTQDFTWHIECIVCHKTLETGSSEKLGHAPSDWIIDTQATCDHVGEEHKECLRCRLYLDTQIIPRSEHTLEEVQVLEAATCAEEGEMLCRCKVCGASVTVAIPKTTNHSYKAEKTLPTCTDQGYTTHTCSICGDSYDDTYVEPSSSSTHFFAGDTCSKCNAPIASVAFAHYDVSKELDESIIEYVVPRSDGCYDVVLVGIGEMYDDTTESTPLRANNLYNKVKTIYIDERITTIGNHAFFGCYKIESIVLHDNLTQIGQASFMGCSALISVAIPASVVTIGQGAFSECTSLGKWDDDEHVTPYLMLSLIPFDDNVMETILIMMDNNLSQKGFNELVRDILENIINENYGAKDSSSLEQYIKFIIFLSSFPKHLNNCKCLKKAIQFNDEFDYSYFRNINKFNFNINIERNKKTIKIKVDVLENNKIIYSFMYMYGN